MRNIRHLVLVAVLVMEPWIFPAGLQAGGLGFLHPLPSSEPEICRVCRNLAQEEKNHVYVYLINGLDPLYLANLNGLCTYLQTLGFVHAEVGQMTSSSAFRDKIRYVRATDPQARVAVVGFSAGAYCAESVLQTLKRENASIDLMVYVGADMIREGDRSQPANVRRVVNITGHGFILSGYDLFFNGTVLPGARNVRLPARHFALPSRPETVKIVVEELVALIGQAPPVVDSSPKAAVTEPPSP